jgi:very-short-patch-repair endonuclease
MANAMARHLRRHPTIGERRLWKELRKLRCQGYHFRLEVLAALGAAEKPEWNGEG